MSGSAHASEYMSQTVCKRPDPRSPICSAGPCSCRGGLRRRPRATPVRVCRNPLTIMHVLYQGALLWRRHATWLELNNPCSQGHPDEISTSVNDSDLAAGVLVATVWEQSSCRGNTGSFQMDVQGRSQFCMRNCRGEELFERHLCDSSSLNQSLAICLESRCTQHGITTLLHRTCSRQNYSSCKLTHKATR